MKRGGYMSAPNSGQGLPKLPKGPAEGWPKPKPSDGGAAMTDKPSHGEWPVAVAAYKAAHPEVDWETHVPMRRTLPDGGWEVIHQPDPPGLIDWSRADQLAANAGRADLDAFERLIGSLTAELRLLREQRDQVVALAAAAKIGMTQHCWCPEGDDGALKHSPYCKGPQSYWDLDPEAVTAVFSASRSSQGEGGDPR